MRRDEIIANLAALKATRQPRRSKPMLQPRYDDIYRDGVLWLDSLVSDAIELQENTPCRKRRVNMDEKIRHAWIQIGTVVDYHSIIGGPITKAAMVVREPAQQLPGGQWVCWLRGKAGCVSCDAVTAVAP